MMPHPPPPLGTYMLEVPHPPQFLGRLLVPHPLQPPDIGYKYPTHQTPVICCTHPASRCTSCTKCPSHETPDICHNHHTSRYKLLQGSTHDSRYAPHSPRLQVDICYYKYANATSNATLNPPPGIGYHKCCPTIGFTCHIHYPQHLEYRPQLPHLLVEASDVQPQLKACPFEQTLINKWLPVSTPISGCPSAL